MVAVDYRKTYFELQSFIKLISFSFSFVIQPESIICHMIKKLGDIDDSRMVVAFTHFDILIIVCIYYKHSGNAISIMKSR